MSRRSAALRGDQTPHDSGTECTFCGSIGRPPDFISHPTTRKSATGSVRFRGLRRCGFTRRGRHRRADRGLFGRICLFNQLIGDVVFVDVTDILHCFLADPSCRDPLDIVEPQIRSSFSACASRRNDWILPGPALYAAYAKRLRFWSSNCTPLK